MRNFGRLALFILLVATPLIKCDFEDLTSSCSSVSTDFNEQGSSYRRVSLEGGAYLVMKGSGFSSRSPLDNRVGIGLNDECPVVEYHTTTTQVVCEAPQIDEAPYQSLRVDVFVDNKRVAGCPSVTYHWAYTPQVQHVIPSAANAGEDIEFYGTQRVSDINDIDWLKIGDEKQCTFKEKFEYTEYTFGTGSVVSIPCTVPQLTPGYYDVSQKNIPYGYAKVLDTAKIWVSEELTYSFAVVPAITSISSNSGSIKGQILTINGMGFSAEGENVVKVGDVDCKILDQSSVQIICELEERADGDMPVMGYHAGLKQEIFTKETNIDNLVAGTSTDDEPDVYSRLDSESAFSQGNYYIERLSGFFVAPKDGDYQFMVSGDDTVRFYISSASGDLDRTKLNLEASSSYSAYRYYNYESQNQFSDLITLQEGKEYLIELYHQEYSGGDHVSLGVIIPGIEQQVNTKPEIKEIEITCESDDEILGFSVTGSDTALWRVSITTDYADGETLPDIRITDLIAFDATETDIQDAFSRAGLSVVVDNIEQQGAKSKYWTIRFVERTQRNVFPVITCTEGTCSADIIQDASPLLEGEFELNVLGNIKTIPATAPWWQVRNELVYGGFKSLIRVYQTGGSEAGHTYRLEFHGDKGDIDDGDIQIVTKSLGGCKADSTPDVELRTIQDGSTADLYYEIIPMHLLRTAHDTPQVTVEADGMLANCPNFNCDYELLATNLPTITAASYAGTTLTMTVSGLTSETAAKTTVTLGYDECTSVAISGDQITADCANPESGSHVPRIHFDNFGYADVDAAVAASPITIAFTITDAQPASINPNGGTVITIDGATFPGSLEAAQDREMVVKFGDAVCTLISVSSTQITCENTEQNGSDQLAIELNGESQTYDSCSYATDSPNIDNISPTSPLNPVLQTTITVTGTNFDADTTNTEAFVTNRDEDNIVYDCLVKETPASSTSFQCVLLGAKSGVYDFQARTSNGLTNKIEVEFKIEVTSVSPTSGSAAGGTYVTISGSTFSEDEQRSLVYIGDEVTYVQCTVVESSANEIICLTEAMDEDMTIDVDHDVTVATRIVEESICAGTCKFQFSTAMTPIVDSIDMTSMAPGDQVTIGGSLLKDSEEVIVEVGDYNLTIDSSSSTEIVATLPTDVIPGNYTLRIRNPEKGYAQFDGVDSFMIVNLVHSGATPTAIPDTGALITVSGKGFHDDVEVTVGGQPCLIRSISSTEIVCRASNAGEVLVSDPTYPSVSCTGSCTLTVSNANQPTVTDISPASTSNGATFTVALTGTGFGAGTIVHLVSTDDASIFYEGTPQGSTSPMNVDFTNVQAGDYTVDLAVDGHIGAVTGVDNLFSVELTASLTNGQVQSSIGGGVTVEISGSGFYDDAEKEKNSVSICGLPCDITASTPTSIECTAPSFTNAQSINQFDGLADASILSGTWFADDDDTAGNAADNSLANPYESSSNDCFVGLDIGEGKVAQLTQVRYFPKIDTEAAKYNGAKIEGSEDGNNYDTIFTLDENTHDGWNSWFPESTPDSYRFFRFSGGDSSMNCALAELEFTGYVLSDRAGSVSSVFCEALVEINGKSENLINAVNYQSSLTPTVTAISPENGSVAGGTTVTLTGTGFSGDNSNTFVYIDGIECTNINVVSTEEITCDTDAAPTDIAQRRDSLLSEIEVLIEDTGYAVVASTVTFFYVDRWSETSTWGGISPPKEGDTVHIPAGQNILLDTSVPKLGALVIEGALIFEDKDLTLDAEYIFIRNGRLQIGTWENPITSKITITIHGDKNSAHLPHFGNKVIGLREGIMDIHGVKVDNTWSRLDTTANVGANSIVLLDDCGDWAVGSQIIIASTDHDHYLSEEMTIGSVSVSGGKTTITFADGQTLKYKHYAGVQSFGGDTIEMRAEVGLLTRNVVIQGDSTSEQNQYGVHIMAFSPDGNDSSVTRVSYTEIRQSGQAFNLGRYSLHAHLIGDVHKSYIVGNAIHHTYNRAVTIHGVHYLRVQKNVAYWVMGHAIFIEDGIETHNLIEDNLVVNVKSSEALLNTDQTPACFWITNPNNIWRGNHCAGSDRYGFWFDLRPHPEGPSATTSYCPTGVKLGEFNNNEAHSVGRYALRVFHEHVPRTYPCQSNTDYDNNPHIQAVYQNFIGWKNRRDTVIGERLGAVKFLNIKSADNHRAGIEISDGNHGPIGSLVVENALIVGLSANAGDEAEYSDKAVRGLITPKVDYFYANDIKFYNFEGNMVAVETCSHCEHGAATDSGGRTAYFHGVSYNNVEKKIRYNIPERAILYDDDGSLTGKSPNGVATFYYPHLEDPACDLDEEVYDGIVCDNTVQLKRILIHNSNPADDFKLMDLRVLQVKPEHTNFTEVPVDEYSTIIYRGKANPMNHWVFVAQIGKTYKMHWANGIDWDGFRWVRGDTWEENDGSVYLMNNYSEYRETFGVEVGGNERDNQTELWDMSNIDSRKHGDWYMDEENKIFNMVFNGKGDSGTVDLTSYRCLDNCPIPVLAVEKEDIIRLWSNASMWPDGVVPQDGDSAVIKPEWRVLLDEDTNSLLEIIVQGDLMFDEDRESTTITTSRIWVQGQLIAGSAEARFPGNINIVLTGDREAPAFILGQYLDVSNKVIAVTGNLTMFGRKVNNRWSRLAKSVNEGDDEISLEADVQDDWLVGDEIVISPTEREPTHVDVRKITKISGKKVTLNESISFYHYGADSVFETTNHGSLDMRAEVAHLTRNIKIEGTRDDGWGGRVYTTQIYDIENNLLYRGQTNLDGVELYYTGQANTSQAGLAFERMTFEGPESWVRNSVIRDSEGWNCLISNVKNVRITNNVFYYSKRQAVQFNGANEEVYFQNNLIIASLNRDLTASKAANAVDLTSAFYAVGTISNYVNCQINNNIVAGADDIAFIYPGGDCSAGDEGPYTFYDNVAHSAEYGHLVYTSGNGCTGISYAKAYKIDGAITSYFPQSKIIANNLVITDFLRGLVLLVGGDRSGEQVVDVFNSYIAAITPLDETPYNDGLATCSNIMGVYVGAATEGAKSLPPSPSQLPWRKVKSNPYWKGNMYIHDVEFANFKDDLVEGCTGSRIITSNENAHDNSMGVEISAITTTNIGAENWYNFYDPSRGEIGIDNCGGWYCSGLRNIIVKDKDGTVTGSPKTLLPNNAGVVKEADNCNIHTGMNGYSCEGLDWGLLTFASQDVDKLTRLISPINLTRDDGFRNDLNSYMDHVWDGFYTGLKRLSQFHSIVQTGKDYLVSYRGTIPNRMRFQLQFAEDGSYVIPRQRYTTPQTVRIINVNTGLAIKPTVYKKDVLLKGTEGCGTNIYYGSNQTIEFVVNSEDDCDVYVELTNAVKGTVRYDMDIEEFFAQDGETAFIDNIANILNIDPARIRITSVLEGSVIINFDIYASKQPDEADGDEQAEIEAELQEIQIKLQEAGESGELSILGAPVLDYSFEITMKNYEEPPAENEGLSSEVAIIAGALGGAAVVIGGIFAYKAYKNKKKRVQKLPKASEKYALSKNVDTSNVDQSRFETDGNKLNIKTEGDNNNVTKGNLLEESGVKETSQVDIVPHGVEGKSAS